jgi:hypothetical protein
LKLTYNVLEFQTIQSGKETSLLFHLVESKYPALSVIFLLLTCKKDKPSEASVRHTK